MANYLANVVIINGTNILKMIGDDYSIINGFRRTSNTILLRKRTYGEVFMNIFRRVSI